jgi:hypothetical protein
MMQKSAREIKRGPITIIWGLFAPLRNPILSVSIACQEFLEDNLGAFGRQFGGFSEVKTYTFGSQNVHLRKSKHTPLMASNMMQKSAREIKRGPITIIWGLFAPLRNPILSGSIACQEFLEDNLGAFQKSKRTPSEVKTYTFGSQNIHLRKSKHTPLMASNMMQKSAREIKRGPITIIWGLFAPLRNPILSASIACQEFLEDNLGAFGRQFGGFSEVKTYTFGNESVYLWKSKHTPFRDNLSTFKKWLNSLQLPCLRGWSRYCSAQLTASAIIFPPFCDNLYSLT